MEVTSGSRGGKCTSLKRLLQKLFPLEVRDTRGANGQRETRESPQRPRRKAAIAGETRRR